MTALDDRDLSAFVKGMGPQCLVSAGNTVSGTLKVDDTSGEVRYRAGRDHAQRKPGELVRVHRAGRQDRIARITKITPATETTFDVEAVLPYDKE